MPCLVQLFAPDLATFNNLKLHVVGAVYGAKIEWMRDHNGQEPPPAVVRSKHAHPKLKDA